MQGNKIQNEIPVQTDLADLDDHIDLQLTLDWQSSQGHHSETRYFYGLMLRRHLHQLPTALKSKMLTQPFDQAGAVISATDKMPEHDPGKVYKIHTYQFKQQHHDRFIIPRIGRFYPQAIIEGITTIAPGIRQPLRITEMSATNLICDFNHALAGYQFEIIAKVEGICQPQPTFVTPTRDPMAQLLSGPGMQVRSREQATDFFSGEPFRRKDETTDAAFYHLPRITDHLDSEALNQVSNLYGKLVPANADILDLMASINSHLPDSISPASITGLGMNPQELNANRQLSASLLHDLNNNPVLPFADASFDAVICTVSVEYLNRPLDVFREVNRILKPEGIFINIFSNRWFPTKAIDLWTELHEFERMGLVSEYFLQSGNYGPVNTCSLQGLRRPADDRYANQLPWSDPIYAVWSSRKSE